MRLVLLLWVVLLCGCGQRGALYLPEEDKGAVVGQPATAEADAATQEDAEAEDEPEEPDPDDDGNPNR